MNNHEIRTREITFGTDNNVISGMPIVFNALSEILWDPDHKRAFREVIAPEAMSQEFLDRQDIMLNVGHDRTKILARYKNGKGSMSVEYADDGVRFKTDVPETQLGHDTFNMIKRGEYTAMSFAYFDGTEPGDVTWEFKTDDGIPVRTVHRMAAVVDVAIVFNPAFSQTSVTARSIDDLEAQLKASIQDVPPVEELDGFNTVEEIKEQREENLENSEINKTEERSDDSYLEDLAVYKQKLENL